ncbi:MAG: LysR family transcriptional regulator [Proteobacteria bacterium]|nr:LysR family transcriptional regulator [Pseudomonadota bacterium]
MVKKNTRILERASTRLKLKQLRLLIAIGQNGNIQAAAHAINVSQPAATKMIKDLELDFEVQLFERNNRGVVPTIYGEALIRHGKLIFSQVASAAQELDDLSTGMSGRVVVGTLLAGSSHLLPRSIELLMKQRPNITVKIVEGTNDTLIPSLRSGEIDLVVGRLPVYRHREGLTRILLFQEEIRLVIGKQHPLCGKDKIVFADLKDYGWILPPVETTLRRQVDQFFIEMDHYHPPMMVESVSYLLTRALLQGGSLISLMPSHVPILDIEANMLDYLPFKLPFGAGAVGATLRKKEALSQASLAFLDALSEVAEELDNHSKPIDKKGK